MDQSGNVSAWSDYYPFGLESRGSSSVNEPKEGFSGKQFDEESGFNYFGARYYNAGIARFVTPDPLSSKYPSLTPYHFVSGNPVSLYEVDGRFMKDVHDKLIEEAFTTVHQGSLLSNRRVYEGMSTAKWESLKQDVWSNYRSADHADNSSYNETFSNATTLLDDNSFEAVGQALHGIQDFYSHSNFADVAGKIFGDKIVTFDEAMQNKGFADLWGKEGFSGSYGNPLVNESSSMHHDNNNFDYFPDKTYQGVGAEKAKQRQSTPGYAAGFNRRYEMAKKHSSAWLNHWRNKREFEKKNDRFDAENK